MRRVIRSAALVISITAFTLGQTPAEVVLAGNKLTGDGSEQTVLSHVNAFFGALRKGDVAAIGHYLADDYTMIGASGRFLTKEQRLEWLQKNVKFLATVEPSELKARGYGDVVVVTGLVTIQGGAEEPTVYERFTHVWVKRGGRWQMVAGQATAAPTQSAPPTPVRKP